MKALILEDNTNLAESLKQLLSQQGLKACIKSSWSSAFPLIQTDSFNIIILDILLPDKKGFEVLKILSEKNVKSQIALISGLFEKKTVLGNIPENLKQNCQFFRKPIDEAAFLKFIEKRKISLIHKNPPFIESLFEKSVSSHPLNFYFPESEVFNSKELVSIIFFAHLKRFTGELEIQISASNINFIQFYKGRIVKVISNSKKSFLGELLVDHGLSLKEDIKVFLEQKENHKKIGEQLVEKGLLSSHMLSFILKEQVKIRLSELMSQPSFQLAVKERVDKEGIGYIEIDFNELDFIEWLADSVQTELDAPFLDNLYLKIQHGLIRKSSQLNAFSIHQKRFLKKYNILFKYLKKDMSVGELIKKLKNRHFVLRLIYFGLLTKSIYLKYGDKGYLADDILESRLDNILSKKSQDLFHLFDLSEQVPIAEIEKRYKLLIQEIHPDSLPEDITPAIREKAKEAILMVTEGYDLLRDEKKRNQYLSKKSGDQFLTVIEQYEKGLTKIKEEDFQTAYKIFLKITGHNQAPSNTALYLLWAQMKRDDVNLINNKQEAVQIKKAIDSCSISLRTSSLFWFVTGLLCLKTGQYEKAKELLTKTLTVQKDFAPAKKELITLRHKMKRQAPPKNKGLFHLFKKSS